MDKKQKRPWQRDELPEADPFGFLQQTAETPARAVRPTRAAAAETESPEKVDDDGGDGGR